MTENPLISWRLNRIDKMLEAASDEPGAECTLAWASGKPLSLGRGVCIGHVVVAGLTMSMLPELRPRSPLPWFMWSGYLPLIIGSLTFAELFLVHFAIRRFEKHFGLACVTVALTIIVITVVESGHLLAWKFGRYFELLRRGVMIGGPGSICLLLGLRLVKAAHDRGNYEEGGEHR